MIPQGTILTKPRFYAVWALLGVLALGSIRAQAADKSADPTPAYQTTLPRVGLEKLLARADSVIEARVVNRESRWIDGHIETTSRLEILRDFKGDLGAKRGEVDVTVQGGKVEGFPVGEFVQGGAYLAPDEHVILFLDTDMEAARNELAAVRRRRGLPEPEYAADSRLHTSPRIVGRLHGKFTVLETAEGGQFVTRQNLVGTLLDDTSYKVVRDYQLSKLERARKQEAAQREAASPARAAAPSSDAPLFEAARAQGIPDDKVGEYIQSRDETSAFGAKLTTHPPSTSAAAEPEASAAEEARVQRIQIPYNQDALAVPVPYGTFEKELLRLVEASSSEN